MKTLEKMSIGYDCYKIGAVQFAQAVYSKVFFSVSSDDDLLDRCEELDDLMIKSQSRPVFFSDGEKAMTLAEELATEIPKLFSSNSAVLCREPVKSDQSPAEFNLYWLPADYRIDPQTGGEFYYWTEVGSSPHASKIGDMIVAMVYPKV